jgi:hypothetical protein
MLHVSRELYQVVPLTSGVPSLHVFVVQTRSDLLHLQRCPLWALHCYRTSVYWRLRTTICILYFSVWTALMSRGSFVTVNSLRMVLRVYVFSHYFVRVKIWEGAVLMTVVRGAARSCASADRCNSAWQAVHSLDTHVCLCRANTLSVCKVFTRLNSQIRTVFICRSSSCSLSILHNNDPAVVFKKILPTSAVCVHKDYAETFRILCLA